eukprot:403346389
MQLPYKQKDQDDIQSQLDIVLKANSKLNESLISLMIENGQKIQRQLKEMQIEAEKKVHTIEKLRSQFQENVKQLHSQQLLSVDIFMMTFQNELNSLQLDKISKYFNDISVMLIKYNGQIK